MWLSVYLLGLHAAITIAVLSGVPINTNAESWLSRAADWVQAFGALLTAWIAWRAFSTWNEQEVARANAGQATGLMPALHELRGALRHLRRLGSFGIPIQARRLKVVIEKGVPSVDRIRQHIFEIEAKAIGLLDEDAESQLISVLQNCKEACDSHFALQLLLADQDTGTAHLNKDDEEEAMEYLQKIGLRQRRQTQVSKHVAEFEDEFSRLWSTLKSLRAYKMR